MDQLTEFKQFLNTNFSDLTVISIIIAGCVIVLSFALREVASWMTKTDKLRSEIRELRNSMHSLEHEVRKFRENLEVPKKWDASESAPSPRETFKLNH